MNNSLFILCPTSQLEGALRSHFGGNPYFLSALGAVYDYSAPDSREALSAFLDYGQVKHIHLVADTRSPFLRAVLEKSRSYGTPAEALITDLLVEHYYELKALKGLDVQAKVLTQHLLQTQVQELCEAVLQQPSLAARQIQVSAWCVDRRHEKFEKVALATPARTLAFSERKR